MLANITREHTFGTRVLYVDGISGSGKFLFSSIMQCLSRVEVVKVAYILDHICGLGRLDHITDDAAQSLIRFYVDLSTHDSMISRELNFREKDLTCVLNSRKKEIYQKRLLMDDGEAVSARIELEKPILHLMGHQLLPNAANIFRSLGERLTYVNVVRNPLSLLHHWYSYIDEYGSNPRNFTQWINCNGQNLPWFAHGIEELYINSSKMDKVIYSMHALQQGQEQLKKILIKENLYQNYVEIPFEDFIKYPMHFIEMMEVKLGTVRMPSIRDEMDVQNVPRLRIADSKSEFWIKKYKENNANFLSSDEDEMHELRDFGFRLASKEGYKLLEMMEEKYLLEHRANSIF